MREGAEKTTLPRVDFPPHFPNTKEMFMGGNGGGNGKGKGKGKSSSGTTGGKTGGGGKGPRETDKFQSKDLTPVAGVRG